MRTTLDIDDEILTALKELARQHGMTQSLPIFQMIYSDVNEAVALLKEILGD